MEYKGLLYAKIQGKYVPTSQSAEDVDNEIMALVNKLKKKEDIIQSMEKKLECNQLLRYDKSKPDQINCISKGVAKCDKCKDYCPKIYKPSYTY